MTRFRGRMLPVFLATAAVVPAAVAVPAQEPASAVVTRRVAVMGTLLRVELEAPSREAAERAAEASVREIERLEALLSTWSPSSAMSALNRIPVDRPGRVDAELRALLGEAFAWADRTGGAFHPAVGSLVDAWDLRGPGRIPSPVELAAALEAGPGAVALGAGDSTVTRRREAAWIDTGGFGKGAALAAAVEAARSEGAARGVLDLGGQLAVFGAPLEVAVAHPRERRKPASWLRLEEASVATSGAPERAIEVEGARFGHILDPRTGHPVAPWGSATVVAADPLVADILATALYVLGPEAGLEQARALDDIGVLLLVDDGEGGVTALRNRALDRWLADEPASGGPVDADPPR